MKRLTIWIAAVIFCTSATAQSDSTRTNVSKDTIRIGSIVIIKHGKNKSGNKLDDNINITMGRNEKQRKKHSNVSTNWWIFDMGISSFSDQTNYATAGSYLVNRPGYPAISKNDFKIKSGKSRNVNIWIFMQRLNISQHHLNLKYGMGLELNNYRFKSPISFREGGVIPYSGGLQTSSPFIFKDSIAFSKNKLAADYLTVPLMLNYSTDPFHKDKGFSISVGVSAGYLYSQRNKQKSSERGKLRNKGDYDLEKFKFSYVAELGIGPVRLYGSYSPQSMYQHSLDMKPFTVGFRFSNW
jgi:hypothetical protein